MKKKLLELLAALGISVPDDKKDEFDALASKLDAPAPAPTLTGGAAAEVQQAVTAALAPVQEQVKALSDALAAEKKAREEAVAALETQRTAETKTKAEKLAEEACAAGKFPDDKKDAWVERLTKDFDGAKAILDDIPANPALVKAGGKGAAGSGKDGKTDNKGAAGEVRTRAQLVEAAKDAFAETSN